MNIQPLLPLAWGDIWILIQKEICWNAANPTMYQFTQVIGKWIFIQAGGGGGEGIYEDKQMRNALNLTKCQSVMKSVHCAGQKGFG